MSRPWADQPYTLISTTSFSKDTSHAAYYVATQMALAHNCIIRGLNAIYLQAAQLPSNDQQIVRDFLTYCQCWCESMHHHHDAEEQIFFPSIEQTTGIKGLMQHNVEQHHAFTPGFLAFHDYARTCSPKDYDGRKLRTVIETFAEPLTQHLHDEIGTLRALDKYDSARIRRTYQRFEKEMMNTDKFRIPPLLFGTSDRGYEGGMHNFPPVASFVPFIVSHVLARRYQGAWRFSPCTVWRDRRELAFVGEDTAP